MKAKVISDCIVQVADEGNPKMDGWFVYQPTSLRRDVEFDYHPPVVPIKDRNLKRLRDRISDRNFSAQPQNV